MSFVDILYLMRHNSHVPSFSCLDIVSFSFVNILKTSYLKGLCLIKFNVLASSGTFTLMFFLCMTVFSSLTCNFC